MVEVNASAWGDWDAMIEYISKMVSFGFKLNIINGSYLLFIFHGKELTALGFKEV